MNLTLQRRLASKILKCGEGRVWIDPAKLSSVDEAITRDDVRRLVGEGVIKAHRKKGVAHKETESRRQSGSIKGTAYARLPRKDRWMLQIRAIRKTLKKLREDGKLTATAYRKHYYKAKGGFYRDRAHLKLLLEKEGIDFGARTNVPGKAAKKA